MNLFLQLSKAQSEGRLGHGIILSHRPQEIAHLSVELKRWIQEVMCPNPSFDNKACGTCPSCEGLSQKSIVQEIAHPDFVYLEPAGETGYNVDQIRAMSSSFSLRLAMSKTRVVWITEAQKLSASGGAPANALLKLLEEPRPNSMLILTTSQPEALLPTIKSRCQHFRFRMRNSPAPKNLNSSVLSGWEMFCEWLQGGAEPQRKWTSPADEDVFWKDRQGAIQELASIREELWNQTKDYWSQWDRHSALRVWDVFYHMELVMNEIKKYAQPQLCWLNFKVNATESKLWKV